MRLQIVRTERALGISEQSVLEERPLTIYVAGPMTGRPNLNREAFAAASERLRQLGYGVYNPAAANLEGWPLFRIMAHVIEQLCYCDGIAMLPGWWRSGGARIEFLLARYLGKRIIWRP